jgi:hypothetical protein
MSTIDPDKPEEVCQHRGFQPIVNVQVFNDRVEDVGYLVTLQMICSACGEAFWFPGNTVGQSFNHPMVTPDGMTLLVPIRPQYTLNMAMDELPDLAPPTELQAREALVRRAIEHPGSYAIKLVDEDRTSWRTRAVLNALEGS